MARHRSLGRRLVLGVAVGVCVVALATLATLAAQSPNLPNMPHLRKQGDATQLVVDGRPFLIRGGELGNSSASNLEYLSPRWAGFQTLRLNTILAPIYWDLLEREEGRFDFTLVDGLVADARKHDLRLVLLWFGSWKNSMSCYAPAWVKKDQQRFPRSADASGRSVEILSPFSTANRDADARAFAALMTHLRAIDGDRHTVIMVQVENEIGMIPSARDHSAEATRLFAGAVPGELMAALSKNDGTLAPELRAIWTAAGAKRAGTWREVFGAEASAEEIFMAWHFARFTQHVTAAGKAAYPLPMFVNAALIRPGYQPGQYPSAGPLPHLIDVWRAGAPAVDFLAPDIYFPAFVEWTRRYARGGNPLFVPEALRSPEAAVNSLYAFAEHDAIGFSPFAIESIGEASGRLLAASNDLVAQLTPLIVEHQGRGTMAGLLQEDPNNTQPRQVRLNGYVLNASFERSTGPSLADGVAMQAGAAGATGAASAAAAPPTALPAGGLVIATAPDEFLFAGIGVTVTFATTESGVQAGILDVEEGRYVNGTWQNIRWLNGDQTHQGRHLRLEPGRLSMQRIRLYRYR
jgi:beta-galactosidase GanA